MRARAGVSGRGIRVRSAWALEGKRPHGLLRSVDAACVRSVERGLAKLGPRAGNVGTLCVVLERQSTISTTKCSSQCKPPYAERGQQLATRDTVSVRWVKH